MSEKEKNNEPLTSVVTLAWIQDQMARHGINQRQMALEMGVDVPTMNRLLNKKGSRDLTAFQRCAFYYYFFALSNR